MQKQFTKNILILLGINLLIKPLYVLGIDAQVQNQLGDETYGLYFALFNFCFLFQIILDMGILNYNSKEVASNRSSVKEHFAKVLGTKLMLIMAFIVALILGALALGYEFSVYRTLFGLAVIMSLQSLLAYLRSHFSALGFFTTDSLLSALDKLLMILILGFFLYYLREISIMKFIYGQIAALVIAIIVILAFLGTKFRLAVRFSLKDSFQLLKQSFPFALIFILMVLYTRMDGVMLERLLDDNAKQAGVYAKSYRLMDAANLLGYLFSMLLLPMFANKLSENKTVNPLANSSTAMLLTCSTIISMVSFFYADELMTLIYSDLSPSHIMVFRYLMVVFWFMSIAYIFGALILAKGETKELNIVLCAGIAVNLVANLYLIPKEGALGAAKATLVTQAFVFFGQFLIAKRKFTLRYPVSYIFKVVIFMILCFVLLYIFSQKVTILWILEVIIAVIILMGISILFGFFRLNLANKN